MLDADSSGERSHGSTDGLTKCTRGLWLRAAARWSGVFGLDQDHTRLCWIKPSGPQLVHISFRRIVYMYLHIVRSTRLHNIQPVTSPVSGLDDGFSRDKQLQWFTCEHSAFIEWGLSGRVPWACSRARSRGYYTTTPTTTSCVSSGVRGSGTTRLLLLTSLRKDKCDYNVIGTAYTEENQKQHMVLYARHASEHAVWEGV